MPPDRRAEEDDSHLPSPPSWAWAIAIVLAAAALVTFIVGRGGTIVLLGVALGFAAFAVLLLSMGDDLPRRD